MSAERKRRNRLSCRTLGNNVDSPTAPPQAQGRGPSSIGIRRARGRASNCLDLHRAWTQRIRRGPRSCRRNCSSEEQQTRGCRIEGPADPHGRREINGHSPTTQPWAMFCLKGSDGRRARRQFGTGRHCLATRSCTGAPQLQCTPPTFGGLPTPVNPLRTCQLATSE